MDYPDIFEELNKLEESEKLFEMANIRKDGTDFLFHMTFGWTVMGQREITSTVQTE